MKPIRVQTVDQLKEHLSKGEAEFFIALRGGFRSSKHIEPTSRGRFWVMNYIDNSTQTLSVKQLFDRAFTNIGEAMAAGAFYFEEARETGRRPQEKC